MAAVLDISILNSFTIVFIFLLVFIGVWGVMTWVDPFKGKGSSIYGLIAFLLAVLVALSRNVVSFILTATPWVLVLGLVAFFFIFFAKMFGVGDASIASAFGGHIGWFIFFIALIILFSLGAAFGPGLLSASVPTSTPTDANATGGIDGTTGSTASGDFGTNLVFTLFHPKIIGVLFLCILGTLTILLVAKSN